jgi:hypothetical protein
MADLRATLYTRHGCPPCFVLRRLARRAARRAGIPLVELEVGEDPGLEARYGAEVPVLIVGSEPPLRGKVRSAEVDDLFRRALRADGPPAPAWRRWLGLSGPAGAGRKGGMAP